MLFFFSNKTPDALKWTVTGKSKTDWKIIGQDNANMTNAMKEE